MTEEQSIDKGFFTGTTKIIIIGAGSGIGLLLMMVIVIVYFKCIKKQNIV